MKESPTLERDDRSLVGEKKGETLDVPDESDEIPGSIADVTPPKPQVRELPREDHNNQAKARIGTPRELKPTKCDYAKVRDRFLGAPTDVM